MSALSTPSAVAAFAIAFQRVSADTDKYEGATVLEPLRGFYDRPIATLDFASLYPSIMLAHNICYSTLIPPHQEGCIAEDSVCRRLGEFRNLQLWIAMVRCCMRCLSFQFSRSPSTRACFVKRSVRRGVLPVIVEELIAKRKEVRQEMKNAKSDFEKKVLNGRQLALKISANSVYGYTGATVRCACAERFAASWGHKAWLLQTRIPQVLSFRLCVAEVSPGRGAAAVFGSCIDHYFLRA